jgi:hypothetical protein
MNKPASVTTEFAEAAEHIPNRLLQKKISAPEARLELSRLVFVHCQAKMSGWYNKFIAALSTIPPEDTFSLIILQSRLRVASRPLWAAHRGLFVARLWSGLIRCATSRSNSRKVVYASYVAGYASELLNENASSKHQHASKRIRKLRDYHLSIFRIVGELVRVSRTDTFILSICEVVSRPPRSLVLNGADTLSIIFRWAVDRRYDELYCRKIGKKFSPS